MTIELLIPEQADAWRRVLAQTGLGDVYYHPAYLAALAARGEGEPRLFVYREERLAMVHVVLKRPLAALPFAHPFADRFDAVTPYGYAGPLVSDPAGAAAAWAAWRQTAAAEGIVAEFIRFHPLLANHEAFAAFLDVRPAGVTVWLDLKEPDLAATMSRSCRRNARLAQREGLTVERAAADFLPRFIAMYHATMDRKAADDYYFFTDDYFTRLAEGLGDDFWLMHAHKGDADCAFTVCLRYGEMLHYHLSCSDPQWSRIKPVDLMLLETARAGQAAGLRRFHLGGGYRGNDSLLEFKSRFSPQRGAFHVGRVTHDRQVVEELAGLAAQAGQAPADPGFFPPYRSGR